MNKVSIIIPVYNKECYLLKTLSSLAKQDYKNCEFILVDDCSCDNSGKICDSFCEKDKRFKHIKNQSNYGASISRNIGFSKSTGEFVCFLDADDIVSKTFVSRLMEKANDSDVMMCGATMIDANDNVLQPINSIFGSEGLYNGLDYWINFQWILSSASWNKIFRRSILTDNNVVFESIKGPEDLLFNYKSIKKETRIYSILDSLYFYRKSDRSLSSTFGSDEDLNDLKILLLINNYLIKEKACGYNILKASIMKKNRIIKCKKNEKSFYCDNIITIKGLKKEVNKQLRISKIPLKLKLELLKINIFKK